jgi:hypothetical protein
MAIKKIPGDVRFHLHAFDTIAIAITNRGRFVLTTDPAGHQQAWWLRRRDGNRLLEEARHCLDVETAAKKLGIRVTVHDRCMARTNEGLGRLDTILDQAKRNGTLTRFHDEYRRRRMAALEAGRKFMPYSAARRRLEKELTRCIAAAVHDDPFELALAVVFAEPSAHLPLKAE